MPVLRFVNSNGFGIVTKVESVGASEEVLSKLNAITDYQIAFEILEKDGWYLLDDGRGNGDNQEFVFTKD